MKRNCFPILFLILMLIPAYPATAQLEDVQRPHTEGNTPPVASFALFLNRDLLAYFKIRNATVNRVEWKFLRQGATQSGVSYPKFYVWARLYNHKQFLESGAVRIEAVDKNEFLVTDYVSRASVQKNPRITDSIFPALVCIRIRQIVSGKVKL